MGPSRIKPRINFALNKRRSNPSSGISFISLSEGLDLLLFNAKFILGFILEGSAVELTDVAKDGLFGIVPADLMFALVAIEGQDDDCGSKIDLFLRTLSD